VKQTRKQRYEFLPNHAKADKHNKKSMLIYST